MNKSEKIYFKENKTDKPNRDLKNSTDNNLSDNKSLNKSSNQNEILADSLNKVSKAITQNVIQEITANVTEEITERLSELQESQNPFNPKGTEGNLHEGHRARLKNKLMHMGFETLAPHEQLELILYAIIPRGNTNIIAHRLLEEFGSLYVISHTDVESLCSIDGVGTRTAEFLRLLPDLAGAFSRSEYENKKSTVLKTEMDAIKYIKTFFMGKTVEYVYMFSLNQNRRIIGVTRLSKGAKDMVNTSVKKIVSTALQDGAAEVILAHNHPGGDTTPSQSDLEATHSLENVLHSLGIKLWLHLIIADNNCRSINFFNGNIYSS